MRQRHIYLPEPQIEMLEKIAENRDISFSEAMRWVLQGFMEIEEKINQK